MVHRAAAQLSHKLQIIFFSPPQVQEAQKKMSDWREKECCAHHICNKGDHGEAYILMSAVKDDMLLLSISLPSHQFLTGNDEKRKNFQSSNNNNANERNFRSIFFQ